MNHPPCQVLGFAILLCLTVDAHGQETESPFYSFTGYYESIQGTLSYYPSIVHWSYLHGADGESIEGLRLSLPHEETTTDFEISELWGNDKGIIFICGNTTILVIKEPSGSPNTPLITISKTSELQLPPGQRSYYQYFASDHSYQPTAVAGVEQLPPDQ